ncbi:MAG: hypothetical protein HUK19_08310 [Fibrobacter sp.]|nr:hypothetical protein [Fibrobacter sp.]
MNFRGKYRSILLGLASLPWFGCGDSGSGSGTPFIENTEIDSASSIIVIEKTSSSSETSGGTFRCFSIDGRQGNCSHNLPMHRMSSATVVTSSSSSYSPLGYFWDSRNNRLYKTVRLGNQIWFAENLQENGNEFFGVAEAAKACPPQSHLPTEQEWTAMLELNSIAMPEDDDVYYGLVGQMLKSKESWLGRDLGSNELLFDAKASGITVYDEPYKPGYLAEFWTSTSATPDSTRIVRLVANDNYAQVTAQYNLYGLQVRCLLDE